MPTSSNDLQEILSFVKTRVSELAVIEKQLKELEVRTSRLEKAKQSLLTPPISMHELSEYIQQLSRMLMSLESEVHELEQHLLQIDGRGES